MRTDTPLAVRRSTTRRPVLPVPPTTKVMPFISSSSFVRICIMVPISASRLGLTNPMSRYFMLLRPGTVDDGCRGAHTRDMKEAWAPLADPLGQALHALRMDSSLYTRSELSAPWGLALPPMQGHVMFHVVTSGWCWLEVEGAELRMLQPGDLALVPHGDGHRLASEPGAATAKLFDLPREQVSERYEILRHGAEAAPPLACSAGRSASTTRPRTASSSSCPA